MMIPIQRPTLRRKDMNAVLQTMADEHIGVGEHMSSLSTMIQTLLGIGTTVALRSFYDALRYSILSLDLEKKSTIVVSALSPKIYQQAIEECGHIMKIVDVDQSTGLPLLDASTEAGALLLYEPFGTIALDERFKELPFPIIEDISESIGSRYNERLSGDIGSVVVCSFEEHMLVSSAGGAAIHTSRTVYQKSLKDLTDPLIDYIGLSDLNVSLALIQFSQLEHNLERRRAIHSRFQQALMRTKHAPFGIRDLEYETNGHGFVVVMDAKPLEGQKFARKYEVETRFAFTNRVVDASNDQFDLYPHALPLIHRALEFPLYPFLSASQMSQIERVITHLP
jgi:perosamine synthetase